MTAILRREISVVPNVPIFLVAVIKNERVRVNISQGSVPKLCPSSSEMGRNTMKVGEERRMRNLLTLNVLCNKSFSDGGLQKYI